jgi:hypothetical protein
MIWRSKSDYELIANLKDQIISLTRQSNLDRERCDRLMEALSAKAGVNLIMPAPDIQIPVERTVTSNPWKDPNLVTDNFALQERKQ